ncbi:MAG TPA: hypothetical protein VHT73_09080 [Thermodesulfobacteriota bacterium]|nr:hypothetical protein [Thermodesulfobacteriota bacterium]
MDQLSTFPAQTRKAKQSVFYIILIFACAAVILGGCGGLTAKPERIYQAELRLGNPLSVGVVPFRTGGFPSNENCMNGNYIYPYEIKSGFRTGEIWLCCIPINELLSNSFSCTDGVLIIGTYNYGSPDDLKVQYCALYDAQSTELRYTPACIPAPLKAGD